MTSSSWRQKAVNTFGTLGYMSAILQWTWTAVVLCYPLVTMDRSVFFPRPTSPAQVTSGDFGALSPAIYIVAAITTLLVLALTVITLIKLPKAIGTSGAKTTHSVAKIIIPAVAQHEKISKKRYLSLSYRIVVGLKYFMTVLPFVLLMFAPAISGLPTKIIVTVGLLTAAFTLGYFSLQLLLAELLRVDKKKVW